MKKLVVARHGACGNDGFLTAFGKKQIRLLAGELRKCVNGDKAVILSSTADCTRQSAEIIGKVLRIEHQPHELLRFDYGLSHDNQKILELVREQMKNAEIIILVTHLEYTEQFPCYFGQHELQEINFRNSGARKGHAWVINCQTKKMTRLAPTIF